jgi:hypothetical protein
MFVINAKTITTLGVKSLPPRQQFKGLGVD